MGDLKVAGFTHPGEASRATTDGARSEAFRFLSQGVDTLVT
jgi:hypothetical protein